jgi:hypothetical protein
MCEVNNHLTVVLAAGHPLNQTAPLQAIDQADYALMPQQEAFCENADRRRRTGRHTFDCKQSLMLLGLNSGFACCGLTEMKEAADLEPKIRQLPIIRMRHVRS